MKGLLEVVPYVSKFASLMSTVFLDSSVDFIKDTF